MGRVSSLLGFHRWGWGGERNLVEEPTKRVGEGMGVPGRASGKLIDGGCGRVWRKKLVLLIDGGLGMWRRLCLVDLDGLGVVLDFDPGIGVGWDLDHGVDEGIEKEADRLSVRDEGNLVRYCSYLRPYWHSRSDSH